MGHSENDMKDSEQKALLALITGSLHAFDVDADISEEEALSYLKSAEELSPQQKEVLKKLGENPFDWLEQCREIIARQDFAPSERAGSEEYAAMHRKKPDEGLDSETLQEIAKRREEILERLKKIQKRS